MLSPLLALVSVLYTVRPVLVLDGGWFGWLAVGHHRLVLVLVVGFDLSGNVLYMSWIDHCQHVHLYLMLVFCSEVQSE